MSTSDTKPVRASERADTTVKNTVSATRTVTHFRKPERSFWQIWNMSFGFLGIQFGWGLQMANMSAIYEYLGARADQIPILWLAAPLTGMIIQPIIGQASDHTWGRLGRRRPYFLTGAILSSLMLLFMPNASALWMAAGMLWILDASINVSMEPFRAFVADILPEGQRTSGFAMQSLFIGLGAVVASALPWLLTNVFHMQQAAGDLRAIPTVTRLSFYIGAAAFIGAVLWTIVTTKEYPPEDLDAFRKAKAEKTSRECGRFLRQFARCPAPCASWARCSSARGWDFSACGCIFRWPWRTTSSGPTTPVHRNTRPESNGAGIASRSTPWCALRSRSRCPGLARKLGRKNTHTLCLLCGALGLMSVVIIHNKYVAAAHDGGSGDCVGKHAFDALCDSGRIPAAGTNRRLHGHLQFLHRHAGDPGLAVFRMDHDPSPQQQSHLRGGCGWSFHADCRRPDATGQGSAYVERSKHLA